MIWGLVQGPKSYNDALAKRFERKKGDMGSSSTGVKDRGIFVSADFRNPRTDQELQVRFRWCPAVSSALHSQAWLQLDQPPSLS